MTQEPEYQKRHLTKDDIDETNTVEKLEQLRKETDFAIERIKVDLEYSEGDDVWFEKAKRALVHNQANKKYIDQRIFKLRGLSKRGNVVVNQTSSLEKKKLAIENRKISASQNELSTERKRQELASRCLQIVNNLEYSRHFMKATRRIVSSEELENIEALAKVMQDKALLNTVEPLLKGLTK